MLRFCVFVGSLALAVSASGLDNPSIFDLIALSSDGETVKVLGDESNGAAASFSTPAEIISFPFQGAINNAMDEASSDVASNDSPLFLDPIAKCEDASSCDTCGAVAGCSWCTGNLQITDKSGPIGAVNGLGQCVKGSGADVCADVEFGDLKDLLTVNVMSLAGVSTKWTVKKQPTEATCNSISWPSQYETPDCLSCVNDDGVWCSVDYGAVGVEVAGAVCLQKELSFLCDAALVDSLPKFLVSRSVKYSDSPATCKAPASYPHAAPSKVCAENTSCKNCASTSGCQWCGESANLPLGMKIGMTGVCTDQEVKCENVEAPGLANLFDSGLLPSSVASFQFGAVQKGDAICTAEEWPSTFMIPDCATCTEKGNIWCEDSYSEITTGPVAICLQPGIGFACDAGLIPNAKSYTDKTTCPAPL